MAAGAQPTFKNLSPASPRPARVRSRWVLEGSRLRGRSPPGFAHLEPGVLGMSRGRRHGRGPPRGMPLPASRLRAGRARRGMKRGSKRQHLAGDEATYCTKPPGTTLASACQGKQAALTLGLLEQTQPEFCGLIYREGLHDGWESAREIPATTHGCWKEHCCWDVSTSAPEDWHLHAHGGTTSCPSSRDPLQNKTQTALLSSPVLLP